MNDAHQVLEKVRKSLGRSGLTVPTPPVLPDNVVRLVRADLDLTTLFTERAQALKMLVTHTSPSDAAGKLLTFLREHGVRSVALSNSKRLDRLRIRPALESAGLMVKSWDEITLDQMYDFDCAVTDVDHAIAESGTLVIKPSARQGRSMSLTPMIHVALVEPKQILPDMLDFFTLMSNERENLILISGPSKTADIEMNVVTGVHGPNVVNAFIVN